MSAVHHIRPLRSYRATLWPAHIEAADVQAHADCGALPTLRLKAPSADWAAKTAAHVSGLRVLAVERIEPGCAPACEGGAA